MQHRRTFTRAALTSVLVPAIAAAADKPNSKPLDAPAAALANQPADQVVLRVQSAYPDKELLNSFGRQWADKVNELGRGKLRVEYLSVGTVAKTTEVAGAVSSGKIDGAFTFPTYQGDYSAALNLWGTGPAFGLDSRMMTAWHYQGGGRELQAEVYKSKGLNLINIAFMPIPTQLLGWANKPLTKVADFQGLKWRTSGLGGEMLEELGVRVHFVPGAEILDAFKSGAIDAADFNNMTSDRNLGLNTVAAYCMMQSYHKASGCLELMINSKVWNGLSTQHKAIIQSAASAMSMIGGSQMAVKNSTDYAEMASSGTTFMRTPVAVLEAQLNAWDHVLSRHSEKDPLFGRVAQSQKDFARTQTPWRFNVELDFRNVFNHYFSRRYV